MALASCTRLGPYEIVAPLGAGGMGEVCRARDTRLGREVAVKILPEGFAALGVVTQYDVSPDGQRFLMNLDTPTEGQRAITLVSNWTTLLPAR